MRDYTLPGEKNPCALFCVLKGELVQYMVMKLLWLPILESRVLLVLHKVHLLECLQERLCLGWSHTVSQFNAPNRCSWRRRESCGIGKLHKSCLTTALSSAVTSGILDHQILQGPSSHLSRQQKTLAHTEGSVNDRIAETEGGRPPVRGIWRLGWGHWIGR